MKINRAYKTELKLNNKERSLLEQCAGLARFTYNWALARRIEEYKLTKRSSNAISQHKQLNILKQTDFAWMYNYSKSIPQNELRNLDKAFQNFFRRVKQKKGKAGFPKFKSKRTDKHSFRLDGAIHTSEKYIQLPRLGDLRLQEKGYLPTSCVKILSATISKQAGKWFVSIQVEQETPEIINNSKEIIGVDLGIKTLAVCSNGKIFENPKALKSNLRTLKMVQRRYSKQQKMNKGGSKNQNKTKKRIQKLHNRVSNIRKDVLHKMTSELAKTKPAKIVIEDLNVSGMMKNRKLSREISDVGMYEIRRQLEYKTTWNGIELVVADRFFASSKLCSCCGVKNSELELNDRSWICSGCGTVHDRDFNAALNLRNYGTASSAGIVCGVDVSPYLRQSSMKQKKNKEFSLCSKFL
jgi:putative transposase